MTNLAALLDNSAAKHPDRTAIVCGADELTYGELERRANRVAQLLVADGIRPGDKVALSCPNLPAFSVIYFGVLKAGATVVPLNVLFKPREIAYHLADSQARAYFAFEGTAELPIGTYAREGFDAVDGCERFYLIDANPATAFAWAAEASDTFDTVSRQDDDTAVILYTSGTTGQRKGAELMHRNMRDNADVARQIMGIEPARPETFLCVLPLFHSFGQTAIQNTAILTGATIVMQARFDPRSATQLMIDHRVTIFAGVPTMYWGLLSVLDDTVDVKTLARNLRVAMSGGAALPVEVHKDFRERFGVIILEGYGLSETSPIASFARYGQQPRVGSVGIPVPGVQMKLVSDDWADVPDDPAAIGEIAIKGHNIMKGYFGRPEATAEVMRDGWFRSGDIGRKDADGFYYIVDRAKDLIIRGGFNVYPREIEELLIQHPAVSLVAVIGVPHESLGEEVKAVVVRNPGDTTSEQDLIRWASEQLAAYKYPRQVEFVESLPMTATGKILKRALAKTAPTVI